MRTFVLVSGIIVATILGSSLRAENEISLAGTWQVALDREDVGVKEKWFSKDFDDTISLPGTLCDGGYGDPLALEPDINNREVLLNLKRKFDYVGAAWYKRTVDIPENWAEKHVTLKLERVLWVSQLWINGKRVGTLQRNESLTTPHYFDVTEYLQPGQNVFALRIDNRKQYDMSTRDMAHAYTNETQTMWNGVLGEISLTAKDNVRIESVNVSPCPTVSDPFGKCYDLEKTYCGISVRLAKPVGVPFEGKIKAVVRDGQGQNHELQESSFKSLSNSSGFTISIPRLIPDAKPWDEFSPHLYEAVVTLESNLGNDEKVVKFGLRSLTNDNARLQINGRPLFLRGTLECCIFPLKGYPPTDKEAWLKLMTRAKEYGLNHLRFHSWCPPKAAFEAADEIGFYLQVEAPYWEGTFGDDEPTPRFVHEECYRILEEYGNHPSFCFLSLGNEISGNFHLLNQIVQNLKERDNRRLYTNSSFTFQKPDTGWTNAANDFWVTQWTDKGWVRGQGVFDQWPLNFTQDFTKALDGIPCPVITHEIGQYSVFPNFREIEKYTGNLVPLNLMAIQKAMEEKGLGGRDAVYHENSGKFAAILYKEEIERAMKTEAISGFQLLDLHDFSGQGTALVGLLDAFWDSKGAISGEEFRRFCAPVVPLARFDKPVYRNSETFAATFETANYSDRELSSDVSWSLRDSDGNFSQSGIFERKNIPFGARNPVGKIEVPLASVARPTKLTLSLTIAEGNRSNEWNIWVYPVVTEPMKTEIVCTTSIEEALTALQEGKKVLLNPPLDKIQGIEGKFVPVFWSPVHFPKQAISMGILCDPAHPALADFPTESHANWQWRDLCERSKTLVIDDRPFEPIVEMMDNWLTNRHLANIVEAKVGRGSLLFCSIDITNDLEKCPQAQWLRISLLRYMESERFAPKNSVEPSVIHALVIGENL
ncbi:MAG: hypothetical protein FWC43_09190 [Planctomycetaceae bacterium]|nr:hypothetical protein [Planctomycetaceae bacterium]MCL2305504.1 hypothetical protein [Planctomycetaceae bacterium]